MIVNQYRDFYDGLNADLVRATFEDEQNKFNKALADGLKTFDKRTSQGDKLEDGLAFDLFSSYGLPVEVIVASARKRNIDVDEKELFKKFNERLAKHQKLSKTASAGRCRAIIAVPITSWMPLTFRRLETFGRYRGAKIIKKP